MDVDRKEINVELKVTEGQLPTDIYGVVYVNSSVGTVNSGGLPFPTQRPDGTYNPEYGSPLLANDGMVYKFDFNTAGKVSAQTALMKTPCYYADLATQYYLEDKKEVNPLFKDFGFRNWGMARLSYMLGTRNELCTAITPMQFENDQFPRLLANYDAGRPYEFDSKTLDIITPIGGNDEWIPATPPFIDFPFPIVESTAHPAFDPVTKELFTVNFTKNMKVSMENFKVFQLLRKSPNTFQEALLKKIRAHQDKNLNDSTTQKAVLADFQDFFQNIEKHIDLHEPWWKDLVDFLGKLLQKYIKDETSTENNVYLMRWLGQGKWQKWKLLNSDKQSIAIIQCMHQTALTKDYIVLTDTGFKLSLDVMFNNPFPENPEIDAFFRQMTTATLLDYTSVYLVDRRQLDPSKDTALYTQLQQNLPYEVIHYSCDYDNPNDQITLHAAHNCTGCFAEWVRTYDRTHPGRKPVDALNIGIPPAGITDINRIGKYFIDGITATIKEQFIVAEPGNVDDIANVGANTWGPVLYTFRNIISPEKAANRIDHIYWQTFGLDKDLLTQFIFNLYKDYPKRGMPLDQVMALYDKGVPFVLSRMNMQSMKFEDAYTFAKGYIFRAIQFVPKKNSDSLPDAQKQGYIFGSIIVPEIVGQEVFYHSEIWLFDGMNLAQGPVCKMRNEELKCGSHLHSAWLEEAESNPISYFVDVPSDYNPLIKASLFGDFLGGILFKKRRAQIQEIFNDFVYPHFPNPLT